MRNQCSEILPPGKGLCVNHDTGQGTFFGDVGVDNPGQGREIVGFQWAYRGQGQNTFIAEQFM
jgi:hypothetical protein